MARRRGIAFERLDFATPYTVHLEPLPCWAHLSAEEYRRRVAEVVENIESQAEEARTYDFDRLRWAGVRVNARGAAEPVTGRTPFPPLLPAAERPQERARSFFHRPRRRPGR